MTTRRTPDGQVYTEVPVVPRHDQLDGRTLGNSHPISAITGLQEALDSKADAVDGGNLVTDEEKAKIETMEANAQENVVETVKVNGTALVPDASKAVNVEVPTVYGKGILFIPNGRKILLYGPDNSVISETALPLIGLTSMSLNSDTKVLTALRQDGTAVSVDISAAADPYTAGNGLSLADGAFSLSPQTEGLLEDLADHLSDQTSHVSAADRASWEGVASGAVRTTGAQTIAGAKTFSSPVTVGTPTGVSHAATKQYVDGKDQTAVHVTGDETVAGAKEFTGTVLVPTPTASGEAATKGYVDGEWVQAEASDRGLQLLSRLLAEVSTGPSEDWGLWEAKADIEVCFRLAAPPDWAEASAEGAAVAFIPRGARVVPRSTACAWLGSHTSCVLGYSLFSLVIGASSGYGAHLAGTVGGSDESADALVKLAYSDPFGEPTAELGKVAGTYCIRYRTRP